MSRARKAALDWLPKLKDDRKRCYQCNDDDVRGIFAKGYRKAEKDLELTVDDICEIMEIREDVLEMDSYENLYEEILKRYKERKEK